MMKLNLENEFILDAVTAPLRAKKLDKTDSGIANLHSAYILVIGPDDGLRAYVEESIRCASIEKQLHITLAVSDMDGKGCLIPCCCEECQDMDALESESLEEDDKSQDIWNIRYRHVIITGFCNKKLPDRETAIVHMDSVLNRVARIHPEKVIYMSDYRVYRHIDDNTVLAEHEMLDRSHDNIMSVLEGMVVRRIRREADTPLAVLRVAPALGPETGFNSFLMDMAEAVAEGKELTLAYSPKCTTFIYISDMMTAIFYALSKKGVHGVFNVSTDNSGIFNIEEITAMVRKGFPEDCRISMDISGKGQKTEDRMAAISPKKLIISGCKSKVDLSDAMELMISYLKLKNSDVDPLGRNFRFGEGYDGKLDMVHKILLDQILMVDAICKKYGIKYFLAGGTLLGAIRHNGFIPWDDDVDIMMLREDYNKFLSVLDKELPEDIFVQLPDTEKLNHQPFLKLRMDDTKFSTKFTAKFPKMHNGLFIDILAHDATAPSAIGRKLHIMDTRIIRSLVFNKWGDSEIKFGSRKIFNKSINVAKRILPMRFLERNMFKTLRRYEGKDTGYLYDSMGRNLTRGAFPAEYLDEAVLHEFEGHMLPVPKEYDKYLTWLYGDYMKEIPASERHISHSIVWMDLGKHIE